MSQFRTRTSSASKSTQTESKNEHEQGEDYVEKNEDEIDAVPPENVDLDEDNSRLCRTQDSHAEATQEISKHVCPIDDDEEDDGLLALEETRC